MKRILVALFVVLMILPAASASARKRKPAAEKDPATLSKGDPPASVTKNLEKRAKRLSETDDDDSDVTKGSGPIAVGPPIEFRMNRASGKKFDLRSLPFVPQPKFERPEREGPEPNPIPMISRTVIPPDQAAPVPPTRSAPAPSPNITFDGLDFAAWGAGHPPDTNGDVGPTYYIQTINTSIGVFRKSDGVRVAAFTFNTFMSQGNFGNLCDTNNFGDPVVLYDTFEDRWVITDFAFQLDGSGNVVFPPGNFQCIAVSMNNDPVTGGWNYYSINTTGGLGDYPKFGIWPDGLYMSANMFGYPSGGSFMNTRLYAFNKTQMYSGSPTVKVVSVDLPSSQFTVLPANARLQTGTPPPGSPNYFASVWNFLNSVQIWKFHVDWDHPGLSGVTGPSDSTMAFWWEQFNRSSTTTAPTPANFLDTLYPRLMVQNQYANIGGVESLWESHTVGAGNPVTSLTSTQSAVRYYQVNVTGGTVAANTTQSFTYSPDATVYRYMPSTAVNRAGDMAIGYTSSNATTNPALVYAGRLAGDPVNSITLTEQTMFAGTGSQSGTCGSTCTRWGDYSAMSLDPDGCKFWYTNEYYAVNGLNHQTRIGSFTFPSCTALGAGGAINGTVTATTGGAPLSGATVALGARTTTTNGLGIYTFSNIPAGTYPTLTASFPGYDTGTALSVVVTDGGTTTQNFSLNTSVANACPVDTTQTDFQGGISTKLDLTVSPGDVKLAKPDLVDSTVASGDPNAFGFTNTSWAGQTFTPVLTGQLTRADVELFCSSCSGANPNITVSIRATTGATPVPTGADLASTTLAGFNDNGAGGLKTVTFSTPLTVTAGTRYALIFRAVATRTGTYAYTCTCSGSGFVNSNAYANGQRVTSANSGSTWAADVTAGGRDLNFVIYVNQGYATTGNLVSTMKDSNPAGGITPIWSTLSWTGVTPANTSLKFQAAGSNSANGPFSFIGPDGTSSTFFTTSAASLSQFYGLRYLQYKSILGSTDTTATPTLSDVTACFTDVDCSGTVTITPSPAQVCPSSAGNTASGPAGETSYSWSITNGTIVGSSTSQSVTYTAGASGNVGLTLNVVETGGCHKSGSLNIPIFAAPTITPGGPTTFCTGGGVTLTSSAATGNQWYLNGNPIGGETNSTYVANASGSYTVTGNGCTGTPSSITTVTVNPLPPTPTITPGGPTTFCAGGSVTLTSSAAAGNQWFLNGNPIGGATNQAYVATASGNYTVVVTDGNSCSSAPSVATSVTVNPLPSTPTITPGGPTTFCAGGSVTLTSSSATGNQWYLNGNPIGGATNQAYVANASGNYTVTVSAAGCTSIASAITTVTVNPIPATPTITPGGPTTFCTGGSVTLTSSSATGNQWYLNGNPIGGETNQAYVATASGNYTVVVTALGCSSAPSAATTVTVNSIPFTPTITPGGPTTFCAGGSVTLTSSSATGNQWYLNGNPIGGETNQAYVATASGNYTVIVTTTGCVSNASTITTVTVNPIPATPTITPGGPTTFCTGGSVTLTSSSASGNQWALNGNPIGGETNQTYVATASGSYTVTVTASGCTSAPSAATVVTVNPIPATPTITPGGPTTFCAGGSVTLTSSSASGNQWLLNGNPIGGATNQTYVATASGSYTVTVTASGCTSAPSAATVVTVNPIPATPTITPGGPTTFCAGGSVTLTSSSASGNQWLLNGNPIGGATNQTYAATASGNYTVTVTASGCTSAPSAATVVTVNPIPATPTITPGGPTTFCAGGSVTLTSSSASGNQWLLNGNPIGGATNQTYAATASGNYTVTVTASGCTSAPSAATVVTVNPNPNATITAPASTTSGSTGSIASVANAGVGATYTWGITGGTITAGAGTNSITFTAGAPGTLTLNVTVTTSAGCSDAKSANVNVTASTVTVTSVSPVGGTVAGGSAVTINGTGFNAGATVTFGGSAATNVVVVSSIKITARTPAHALGAVNVTVTNTNTTTATLVAGYLYKAQQFDPNNDTTITTGDIFYLINFLYMGGPPPNGPAGLLSGDANGDGLVDSADIFYLVNYLFLGGPRPNAIPTNPNVKSSAVAGSMAGSITLGKAADIAGHYVIPVVITSSGSIAPQAMSLKVHFGGEGTISNVAVRKAGAAKDLGAAFEISRQNGNDLSYVVSYDPRNGGLNLGASHSAIVAEIEIDVTDGNVGISVDPTLTMLSDQGGMTTATVANGKLAVSGTAIVKGETPRPHAPANEVN